MTDNDNTIAAINALPDDASLCAIGLELDPIAAVPLFISGAEAKALVTELTDLRQTVERYEDLCRMQGHIYGNTKGYGRRAFWTEAGWEIEAHRDDPEDGYYADDALAAVRLIGGLDK